MLCENERIRTSGPNSNQGTNLIATQTSLNTANAFGRSATFPLWVIQLRRLSYIQDSPHHWNNPL